MPRPSKLLLAATIKPVLVECLGAERADRLWSAALARCERHARDVPEQPSVGGRLMVRCAALTVALYRELLDDGMSPADARTQVSAVTAAVYDKMAAVPWLIARWSARTPLHRLRRATDAFRTFPFGAPAYEMVDVEASDDRTVAFDVTRCPVAAYFRGERLPELCVSSFCDLDFALAEKWGARLTRTTTLAAGNDRCDFRWRLRDDLSA